MPTELIPANHPQRALTQLLVGVLNDSNAPHDLVLGALISLYRHVALSHPCCLAESARNTGELHAELVAKLAHGSTPLNPPHHTH